MKKLTFDPKIRKGISPINREILLIISVMYWENSGKSLLNDETVARSPGSENSP